MKRSYIYCLKSPQIYIFHEEKKRRSLFFYKIHQVKSPNFYHFGANKAIICHILAPGTVGQLSISTYVRCPFTG